MLRWKDAAEVLRQAQKTSQFVYQRTKLIYRPYSGCHFELHEFIFLEVGELDEYNFSAMNRYKYVNF